MFFLNFFGEIIIITTSAATDSFSSEYFIKNFQKKLLYFNESFTLKKHKYIYVNVSGVTENETIFTRLSIKLIIHNFA